MPETKLDIFWQTFIIKTVVLQLKTGGRDAVSEFLFFWLLFTGKTGKLKTLFNNYRRVRCVKKESSLSPLLFYWCWRLRQWLKSKKKTSRHWFSEYGMIGADLKITSEVRPEVQKENVPTVYVYTWTFENKNRGNEKITLLPINTDMLIYLFPYLAKDLTINIKPGETKISIKILAKPKTMLTKTAFTVWQGDSRSWDGERFNSCDIYIPGIP